MAKRAAAKQQMAKATVVYDSIRGSVTKRTQRKAEIEAHCARTLVTFENGKYVETPKHDPYQLITAAADFAAEKQVKVISVYDRTTKKKLAVNFDGTSDAWRAARKNRAKTIRTIFAELKAPTWGDISAEIWKRYGYSENDVYIMATCRNAGLVLTRDNGYKPPFFCPCKCPKCKRICRNNDPDHGKGEHICEPLKHVW